MQHVHPRLVALGTQHANGGWLALANITAGQQTYQLTVTVARSRGPMARNERQRTPSRSQTVDRTEPRRSPAMADAHRHAPTDGTGELHLSPSTTEQITAEGLEQARALVLTQGRRLRREPTITARCASECKSPTANGCLASTRTGPALSSPTTPSRCGAFTPKISSLMTPRPRRARALASRIRPSGV